MKKQIMHYEYAAIRRNSIEEYIDTLTLSSNLAFAKLQAESAQWNNPTYAKDNPVIRYSKIKLTEVKP